MNKAMTPTKGEPKAPLVDVHDVKGWCEYEPSYDGVVTHINTAGAKLFGFNSPDDVIGKNQPNKSKTNQCQEKFRPQIQPNSTRWERSSVYESRKR